MEKWKFLTLPGLELQPLSRPARNQSLYGLRYPGSFPKDMSLRFSNQYSANAISSSPGLPMVPKILSCLKMISKNKSPGSITEYC
jgi:hypothetical protein